MHGPALNLMHLAANLCAAGRSNSFSELGQAPLARM